MGYTCYKNKLHETTLIPRDCSDIKRKWPKAHSGVYKIFPSGGRGYDVLCDMETDTGGWTVFHKRFDGSVNFYRNWKDYKQGFGSVRGEFWLGLQALHEVTVHGQHELRVDLADFEGNTRYAKYSKFSISNESNGYQILLGGYTGTAGESMEYANGMKFTTKDRDNDKYGNNCAIVHGGAWWFKDCFRAHLNGRYTNDPKSLKEWKGLIWNTWKGSKYSLKSDVMMVRRHHN
ncbi:microfibril-associated glycoprotein 4-like [Saccostrea cucullata]|uniref:microfibril-associated glycoprotein 4-like n=1 Tax=Saccostrea cuccullata TaxID=36930 RepID=UPI002ED033FE